MAEESWDRCWELNSAEQRYFRIVIEAPPGKGVVNHRLRPFSHHSISSTPPRAPQ